MQLSIVRTLTPSPERPWFLRAQPDESGRSLLEVEKEKPGRKGPFDLLADGVAESFHKGFCQLVERQRLRMLIELDGPFDGHALRKRLGPGSGQIGSELTRQRFQALARSQI
jgi:hypothetical protein